MADFGFKDSREASETYIRHFLPGKGDEKLVSAFLDSGPRMVSWVEENSSARFVPSGLPDYHMDVPGARPGRSMITKPFDGKNLGGTLLREIRLPLPGTRAFGSLQVDALDLGKVTRPFDSFENAAFCTNMIVRYTSDLIRYGKGSLLCNGNALVGSLLHGLIGNSSTSTTLWNNSSAQMPILNDGRVVGLKVSREGKTLSVQARKGVILAAGGFPRSKYLATKYLPTSGWTAAAEGNTGDGLHLGIQSGGALAKPLENAAIWSYVSNYYDRNRVHNFPHLGLDRTKPGCLIVDTDGKRFANESEAYQPFGRRFNDLKVDKAYFICDHRFIRRYGVGAALPWPYPLSQYVRRGYVLRGRTLSKLAIQIDVDPGTLIHTVERFNNFAREGRDLDFGRGEASFDKSFGDHSNKPNQSLAPCEQAPFYAVPMYSGNIGTVYGFRTNADAQVLNEAGDIVPGLYAVGSDQNSVFAGTYPGAGATLGPGMVFGYRAGNSLVRSQ